MGLISRDRPRRSGKRDVAASMKRARKEEYLAIGQPALAFITHFLETNPGMTLLGYGDP